MDRRPLESLKAVSKYDPSKSYEWPADQKFSVTGSEIDIWNKAFTLMVTSPEYQRFMYVQQAALTMQAFIKDGVEQDLIKELKEDKGKEVTVESKPDESQTLKVADDAVV